MRPVYSNDTSAPRMPKAKFSKRIVTRELYSKFKKEHPEHKEMTWEEFYKKWQDIAQTIRVESITNPLGVKLGSYTGELKFQWLPHKFEAPDNHTSQEAGEKINQINLINKGKVGIIKWERRWAVKFNRMLQFFAFDATREMNKIADEYARSNSEKVRRARNTLGGYSIWRQLKAKNNG